MRRAPRPITLRCTLAGLVTQVSAVVLVLGACTSYAVAGICNPPAAVAEGSRYFAVTPDQTEPGQPVALRFTSPSYPCLEKYVDASGFLIDDPVFRTPAEWGTVHVGDRQVVPASAYVVETDCGGSVSLPASVQTWMWGDTNDDGVVDFDDIVCLLDGFAGNFPACSFYALDLQGDVPNRIIDFDDILAGLNAFSGASYPGPIPGTPPGSPVLNAHETSTSSGSVMITGTAEDAELIQVTAPEGFFLVDLIGGAFNIDVPLTPNMVNDIFFVALSTSCATPSAPAATSVTQDGTAPNLFIDFPVDGAELTTDTTNVTGRVGDLLSGFLGLTVEVNGVEAIVDVGIGTNGTFLAMAVPLAIGENTIAALAVDALGNQNTHEITVHRIEIPLDVPQMVVFAGNNQTAEFGSLLPNPIVVEVLNEADGTPFVNKIVTFDVTRSDGRLSDTNDEIDPGVMTLQIHTDEDGLATAFWTLGTDAGCGNNRITVTSTDIAGSIFFCASATPGPAAQINIGSGNNQRAEVNSPAPEPLEVWVSDSGNGVSGVSVTFTVIVGDGKVDGQESVTILTGDTGHADVALTLGSDPGNNLVEAQFPDNPAASARFTIFGLDRDEGQPTSFSGIVLDNGDQPIQGAICTLDVGSTSLITESDINGQFHFDDTTESGPGHLSVDATTAFHIGGETGMDVPMGTFPSLSYAVVLIPNAANSLATPVRLPPLNPANKVEYDGINGVELTVEGVEGLKFIVAAGTTVTLPDGTIIGPDSPGSVTLSLDQVHTDDIPMPFPDGAAPPYAGTFQPGGAAYDPPVQVELPNMAGLAPGAISYFMSFNHDTGNFEIVATGSVSADGSTIVSDPGSGILVGGWHGARPPNAITGHACKGLVGFGGDCGPGPPPDCEPPCDPLDCMTCSGGSCVTACPANECLECIEGTGFCDALCPRNNCQDCEDGFCIDFCDLDDCRACINGACTDTCPTNLCQECMGGVCETDCNLDELCQECMEGFCVVCPDGGFCFEGFCEGG